MFGYDDAELERIRRGPRRLRWWVVLLQAALTAALVPGAWVLDLLNDPARLRDLLNAQFPNPKFVLDFSEVEWLPVGRWYDPWSWKIAVTGLAYDAIDPKPPDWRTHRVTVDLPVPSRVGEHWTLHVPWLRVNGLAIQAHQQRPPPPWKPVDALMSGISADTVEIIGASFDAPEDPPLGVARALGIRGVLRDLLFVPGRREVSARGSITVASFTTGAITVSDGRLPTFVLDRSNLHLAGTFAFAGTQGQVEGDIRTFHVRSEVDMHVVLQGARLQEVVTIATGEPSVIDGWLDLDLRVEAGGERPRGTSLIHGHVSVREGKIQLGRKTRYLVLDALSLVPWIHLNAYNQVELKTMEGEIVFTRGDVTLKHWTYPLGQRPLRVDGRIAAGDLYLFVRLLPRVDRPRVVDEEDEDLPADRERLGLGLIMWGTAQEQQFKLASKDELRRPDPWVKVLPERASLDDEPTRKALRAEEKAARDAELARQAAGNEAKAGAVPVERAPRPER